jgi:arabinofuranosyltransferase
MVAQGKLFLAFDRKAPGLMLWLSSALLLLVVCINAWVSDDAYITFRVCYNFVHGYGPVFNPGERVQVYTNPLWMLLFSGLYVFTEEGFFSSIILSLVLLSGILWLMHTRIFKGTWAGVWVVFLMGWSLSFVEYSTSGLENILNGFLLTLFFVVFFSEAEGRRRLVFLSLIAALGMVSRMDTALLYAPALAFTFWQTRSWRSAFAAVLCFLPFFLWEMFATFYYGFPFPNSAYAKLNAGVSQSDYWQHGLWYYANALRRDPVTLAGIAAGIWTACRPGLRRGIPLAAGLLLYAIYVARIGGDFMAGRFLYLPFLGGLLLFAKSLATLRWSWVAGAILLLLGICNLHNPWYRELRPAPPRSACVDKHGIADERGWYHNASSLAALNDTSWVKVCEHNLDQSEKNCTAESRQVMFWDFLGYMGYSVGPCTHVSDRYALADPLLSRLPRNEVPGWRIGHLDRVFPRGYRESLYKNQNQIWDDSLCIYYQHLLTITQGPLWSAERLQTIWRCNLGQYDHLVNKEFYRNPSRLDISLAELQRRHPDGEGFGQPGQTIMFNHRPLTVHLDGAEPFEQFEISLGCEVAYRLDFMQGEKKTGEIRLPGYWSSRGLETDTLQVPVGLAGKFDAIRIEATAGSDYFSLGHLIPLR